MNPDASQPAAAPVINVPFEAVITRYSNELAAMTRRAVIAEAQVVALQQGATQAPATA